MDWDKIIQEGISLAGDLLDSETAVSGITALAGGLLEDDRNDQAFAQNKEIELLKLQDNERDRASGLARTELSTQASLEAARIGAEASKENLKKRILGDVLLKQGDAQGNVMLESFRSAANKPERFNNAASILANVLSR